MSAPIEAPVEAVVFDVGKVLIQWDLREIYRDLIPDPAERDWFVAHVVTPEWHFQHDAGRPLAEILPERIALFPEHEALIRRYASHFNESVPGPISGSMELAEELAARGVPLFAITNFGAEFWPDFHTRWPVFRHFRDVVVSGIEKLSKPDPAIYALAARRFGHDPSAMLFIDDNAANVTSARDCGWQVHHFRDAAALRTDLIARGLLD
ncbi:MAG TPA: HAD family phosphatase [Novosphingobium sp.]|nr:HAD family phosphatase [Novosphingobium sp.]HNN55302.1 HAD family phosphatase [Novosphingobium sp.]